MTQRRAAYEFDRDPLDEAKAQYVEQMRRRHGSTITIEIVTREVIGPEPERSTFRVVGEWLTLSEAAAPEELDMSWSTLKRWGVARRFRMEKVNGQWSIHRSDVDRLKAERR